jgi:UDP-glucose 4-epimerase
MNSTPTKTVLISGANGYFGGVACQYFEARAWTVLKATRQPDADVVLDLDLPHDFAKQTVDGAIDLFIHAAAAHEVTCREQPYRSVNQNVVGTKAALDFCVSNQIPKFVYLSTFHVFGNPQGIIDERTQPLPANDYGLSHLQAEEYVQMYTRQQSIQGLIVRPSNFFGVPADVRYCKRWTLTPLAFCKEAIENRKIVLRTPGFQQRNFISVLDICGAIDTAIHHPASPSLFHIAGRETISIRELAKLVQRVALETLGIEVELSIPEGIPIDSTFTYTSQTLNNLYQPTQTLEIFVADFIKVLNTILK